MADTDILIKDLPLTETVNDSDDLVTEDSSPTTHRIKASVVKNYINAEQNDELDGLKVDLDNVNSNIGSLSSKVDEATTTVSNMQTSLNTMDGRVTANADGISELNSALADKINYAYTSSWQTTHTITASQYPVVIILTYSSVTPIVYWFSSSQSTCENSNVTRTISDGTMTITCPNTFICTVISRGEVTVS